MKKLIRLFLITAVSFSSCDFAKFANDEKDDAQKANVARKNFFKSIYFDGVIERKILCSECGERSKFQIIISLKNQMPEQIPFSYQVFPPQYSFEENKKLKLSITGDLYDLCKEGILVRKYARELSITIDNKKYNFISEEKSRWLVN